MERFESNWERLTGEVEVRDKTTLTEQSSDEEMAYTIEKYMRETDEGVEATAEEVDNPRYENIPPPPYPNLHHSNNYLTSS